MSDASKRIPPALKGDGTASRTVIGVVILGGGAGVAVATGTGFSGGDAEYPAGETNLCTSFRPVCPILVLVPGLGESNDGCLNGFCGDEGTLGVFLSDLGVSPPLRV